MNRFILIKAAFLWLVAGAIFSLYAEGKQGSIEWSDGKKIGGAVSLSPGKDIRIFQNKAQVSIRLEDVKEIRMTVEKEEMREGFTFPEAGKAIKEKNGEIYPVRYFESEIILNSGKSIKGHIYTTTFFVENQDSTQKVVLQAKTTGQLNQKIEDIIYPTLIKFDEQTPAFNGASRITLSSPALQGIKNLIAFSKPSLSALPATKSTNSQEWEVPCGDPSRIIYSLVMPNGNILVSLPEFKNDEIEKAILTGFSNMSDFYDTQKLLGYLAENDLTDVYTVVLLSRTGTTHSFAKDKVPWSIVLLRWKYDPEEKKLTLLNRAQIATGRSVNDTKPPETIIDASLPKMIFPIRSESGEGKGTP